MSLREYQQKRHFNRTPEPRGQPHAARPDQLDGEHDTLSHKGFEHGWDVHSGLGWFIVAGGIVLFLIALAARVGRPRIWFQLGLTVALIVQLLLVVTATMVVAASFLSELAVAWLDPRARLN